MMAKVSAIPLNPDLTRKLAGNSHPRVKSNCAQGKHMNRLIPLAILLAAATNAAASMNVYVVPDRAGVPTFSDHPPSNGAAAERTLVVASPADPAAATRLHPPNSELLIAASGRTALDRAYNQVVAARKALKRAQARRKEGVTPLPGERQGMVNGKSRLDPAYFARQKELRHAVEVARLRLDAALKRWNQWR